MPDAPRQAPSPNARLDAIRAIDHHARVLAFSLTPSTSEMDRALWPVFTNLLSQELSNGSEEQFLITALTLTYERAAERSRKRQKQTQHDKRSPKSDVSQSRALTALSRLAAIDRAIIVLSDMLGMSHHVVGKVVGVSEISIDRRLVHLRKPLRAQLRLRLDDVVAAKERDAMLGDALRTIAIPPHQEHFFVKLTQHAEAIGAIRAHTKRSQRFRLFRRARAS